MSQVKHARSEDSIRAYLDGMAEEDRPLEITLLMGFLAGYFGGHYGSESAAQLLYALADAAVTGKSP